MWAMWQMLKARTTSGTQVLHACRPTNYLVPQWLCRRYWPWARWWVCPSVNRFPCGLALVSILLASLTFASCSAASGCNSCTDAPPSTRRIHVANLPSSNIQASLNLTYHQNNGMIIKLGCPRWFEWSSCMYQNILHLGFFIVARWSPRSVLGFLWLRMHAKGYVLFTPCSCFANSCRT